MLVATTETGSKYEIRRGIYRKNGGWPQKIWSLKVAEPGFQPRDLDELFGALDAIEDTDRPEVGKRLFIGGRDGWDYSTVIVRVDEYRELDSFFIESRAARRLKEPR